MAISRPQPNPAFPDGGRLVLRDIPWRMYHGFCLLGDQFRFTYDHGDLECFMPSALHKGCRHLISRMVDTLTEELHILVDVLENASLTNEALARGLHVEKSYHFLGARRAYAAKRIPLVIDSPPELVIEVDFGNNRIDRIDIFSDFGLPEVWRCDGQTISILRLGPDGKYMVADESVALPCLRMHDLSRFMIEYELANDEEWDQSFREWVRSSVS
jgi:Uma2 family endonuclease